MSIRECLQGLEGEIHEDDIARLEQLSAEYYDANTSIDTTDRKAVSAGLQELMSSRADFVSQIQEQGGVAPTRGQSQPLLSKESQPEQQPQPSDATPDQPEFYSGLLRSAQALKQEKGNPQQLLAAMKKAGGVKDEEISTTGLDTFLADKTSITKQEIVDHVQENMVEVETVTKEGPKDDDEDALLELGDRYVQRELGRYDVTYDKDEEGYVITDENGELQYDQDGNLREYDDEDAGYSDLRRELEGKAELMDFNELNEALGHPEIGDGDSPKFRKESIPGGENYREVLLRMPQVEGQPDYKSPHFDEANILAHIRMDDRKGGKGENILFINEIQSDWHQEGRKRGYSSISPNAVRDDLAKKYDLPKDRSEWNMAALYEAGATDSEAIAWGREVEKQVADVPDAPFKGNAWAELSIKKILRIAAEGNYDAIAWTSGDAQVERYGKDKLKDQGAGMRSFYDGTLPNLFKKVSRKLDKKSQVQILGADFDVEGEAPKAHAMEVTPKAKEKAMAGQPLFSKLKSEGATGYQMSSAVKAVAPILQKMNTSETVLDAIQVVQSVSDIPIKGIDVTDNPKGVYSDGKVFLIADNIKDDNDSIQVLSHELVGHHGVLAAATTEEWNGMKKTINNLVDADNIRANEIWAEVEERYADESDDIKAKEFLAIAAERKVKEGAVGNLVKQFKEILRRTLKGFGFTHAFSESELDIILSNSEAYLAKEAVQPKAKPVVATEAPEIKPEAKIAEPAVAKVAPTEPVVTAPEAAEPILSKEPPPKDEEAERRRHAEESIPLPEERYEEKLREEDPPIIIPPGPAPTEPSRANIHFPKPVEGLAGAVIRTWQDKFRPALLTQKEIEKVVGKEIPEHLDLYRAEEAYHGKTENDIVNFEKEFVDPLTEKMAEHNVSREELDEFLIAKHAKERNIQIAKINPKMQDGGSGMTNQEAENVFARIDEEKKWDVLEELAGFVYGMQELKQQLKRDGLQDDEITDAEEAVYKHYVPLYGMAEDEKSDGSMKSGVGFRVFGKESMRAMGNRSKAESPTLHTIKDVTEKIIRSRKNEVGNVLLELIEQYPNENYWEIFTDESPDRKRKIIKNAAGETVIEGDINMGGAQRDYFATKRDGKQYYIKLKDERLMNAMQDMGPESMGVVLRGMANVTRFLSSMSTSYNPEFMISNFSRDIQSAVFNLLAEQDLPGGKAEGQKLAGKMVKSTFKSMRAVHASLTDKVLEGEGAEWQKYFEEFKEDGAKTGWFDMKDVDQLAKDLETKVDIAQGGTAGKFKKFAKVTKEFVENANSAVENAVRLSVYRHAREAGVSRKKAASLAKNLTVNFNRKGEIGQVLNSLYMFANASVQGTAVFLRSVGTFKKVDGRRKLNNAQKFAAGMVGASFALAMLNREMAGEDDDDENFYDKVPNHVRERNIVIMKSIFGGPEGEYYTIPLPYGYNIFHVLGDSAESAINSTYRSKEELAVHSTMSLLGSFSPIGFEQSKDAGTAAVKTITPTVLSPFVQLAVNENFFGGPIYKENYPFGTPRPDSALTRRSTKAHWKAVTDFMNEATGGSAYRSGYVDVSPDTLNHLFSFGLGGAGAFVSRAAGAVEKGIKGDQMDAREIPFLRRTQGKILPYEDVGTFYDRANEIKQISDEYESLRGKERREFRFEHKKKLRLLGTVKAAEKSLREKRKLRRVIEGNKRIPEATRQKRLEAFDVQMKRVVDRFNKRYRTGEH